MTSPTASRPELGLTLRLSASAGDSRRGIVRAHPEVLVALGIREWDAVEIVGSRTTGAVIAAARSGVAPGLLVVDEVVSANCGLGEDARVHVRQAGVTGATSVTVSGLPPAGRGAEERVLRTALLGKVVRVGDAVTLLPRDLGPDFPTGAASTSLRNNLGAGWGTTLLTVTATDPAGTVSIQPTTSIRLAEVSGGTAPGGTASGGATSASAVPTETAARPQLEHHVSRLDPADLVGMDDHVEVLTQWLHLALDRPDLVRELGASAHLGVLVTGPVGVGKATLARAVIGDRPHVVLDGPQVGALESGARLEAVRAATARVVDTSGVLLVTDIDALLPAEPEPASTLALEELRSVVAAERAVLVATVVDPSSADPRLRDPEMCDRTVDLTLPSGEQRARLLEVLLRGVPVADDVDLAAVADRTPGYVAGDLRAVVREAALRAAGRAAGTEGSTATEDSPATAVAEDTQKPDDADRPDADPADAVDGGRRGPGPARIEQGDLLAALSVIRPLSRSGTAELSLGSITLEDVGDMVEVKQALTETVLWPLAHPGAFRRMGVQPSRGVLLYGPPGCGKTFVVRALAASGRLTVHMVKGAELMDKWVGSSEKAVRDLFRRARDSAPSLVFLDEVDALAPRRGQSSDSGVSDRVVAALLTELDGAEPLDDVVVLGATNRPELIDPALLRPGRLERLVFVPPPDAEARTEILEAAGRDVPLADGVSLADIAAELEGYSAADCAALLREAALTALRRDIEATDVTEADLESAQRVVRPSLDPVQVEALRRYADTREA